MENKPKLNISEWAEEDRPREKMILKGSGALSDAELLAIGTPEQRESFAKQYH